MGNTGENGVELAATGALETELDRSQWSPTMQALPDHIVIWQRVARYLVANVHLSGLASSESLAQRNVQRRVIYRRSGGTLPRSLSEPANLLNLPFLADELHDPSALAAYVQTCGTARNALVAQNRRAGLLPMQTLPMNEISTRKMLWNGFWQLILTRCRNGPLLSCFCSFSDNVACKIWLRTDILRITVSFDDLCER